MSSLTKKIVIGLSVAVFAYVATGYVLGRSTDDRAYRALSVYSEVLEHIQHDYVDDPSIPTVTAGALHGLVDSLDPQSGYMSPFEYTDYKQKSANPSEASAGVALTKRIGYISVIATLPGSPAEKAGLHLGDLIEKIAGFTTSQMTVDQAQVLLSGASGTVVKLSVIRRGKTEPEPDELDITLEKLAAPKLTEDKLPGDIAYLHVPEFTEGVTKEIRDALAQFNREGEHKLILDLRDCAAGDDREGISTAQLFLASGTIATLKGQTVTPEVSAADASKVAWKQPVTVLIGSGTAGAAEIVAGAIGGNHRGETIGTRTYGTASMQKLIQLDDGSALILTVATYYTPDGKEIAAEGVDPTTVVQTSPENAEEMEEVNPSPPSSSPDDPVVKKAIEILQAASTERKAA